MAVPDRWADPETRLILCVCGRETKADGEWVDYFDGDGMENTGWSAHDEDLHCVGCGADLFEGLYNDHRGLEEAVDGSFLGPNGRRRYRRVR